MLMSGSSVGRDRDCTRRSSRDRADHSIGGGRPEGAELLHSKIPSRSVPMTDYQAPLKQMKFTLEHLADFGEVSALAGFPVGRRRHHRGRARGGREVRERRAGPDQRHRRPAGRQGGRRRRAGARGIHGRLRQVLRRRLAGHREQSRVRRPGPAEDPGGRLRRDVGGRERRLRALPGTVAGRDPRHGSPRHGGSSRPGSSRRWCPASGPARCA